MRSMKRFYSLPERGAGRGMVKSQEDYYILALVEQLHTVKSTQRSKINPEKFIYNTTLSA